jgi:hypothetical protein
MRLLISLVSFVCALLGFDPQPGTVTWSATPSSGQSRTLLEIVIPAKAGTQGLCFSS